MTPTDLPPGLPPLPPVPEGFDRWEYRGHTGSPNKDAPQCHLLNCDGGGEAWGLFTSCDAKNTPWCEAVHDEPAPDAESRKAWFVASAHLEDGCEITAGSPEMLRAFGELPAPDDALAPFLNVARGIPDNWPGECILRFDQRADGSIFLGYHGVHDAFNGITIDQWRALLREDSATPPVAGVEPRVIDGKIQGIVFAVSNDGGKTGVAWRENVHDAMAYCDLQGGDYAVVAVRKPQPPEGGKP